MSNFDKGRRDFCIGATAGALSGVMADGKAGEGPGADDTTKASPGASGVSRPGERHLWDREPSLWEEACRYRLIRPLSAVFGWEGPSGGAFGGEYSREPGWKFTAGIDLAKPGASVAAPGPDFTGPLGEGVNLANGRVFSSFWGTPDRMVLSIGKTDVFNRAAMHLTSSMKPVGQILILAGDFAGIPQPEVCTSVHDGVHRLSLAHAAAKSFSAKRSIPASGASPTSSPPGCGWATMVATTSSPRSSARAPSAVTQSTAWQRSSGRSARRSPRRTNWASTRTGERSGGSV
jgi:hypothetical protein